MSTRTKEDQRDIEVGKYWLDFKETEWYKDLSKFIDDRVADAKDLVLTHTLNGEHQKAIEQGYKLRGLEEVTDFIEGNIKGMRSILEEERSRSGKSK